MRIALRLNLDANGSETFSSPEMSPGMQRTYRRVERRFSARHDETGSAFRIVPKLCARVIVDGHDFASGQCMPPEYRRFYEEILARAVPVQRAVQIVTQTEHANSIKRIVTLVFLATSCAAAIVYLWLRGYYG